MKPILIAALPLMLAGAAQPDVEPVPDDTPPPALALPQAAPSDVPLTGTQTCPSLHTAHEEERQEARVMTLDEAASGRAFYAVYRTDENGCPDPLLASGEKFGR